MPVYFESEDQLQDWDRNTYGEPIYDRKLASCSLCQARTSTNLPTRWHVLVAQPGTKHNSDKIANITAELGIWDNLKYKFSWGSDLAFWGADGWSHPYYLNANNRNENSQVTSEMNRGYTWQIENLLTYDKTFGQHSFSVVLGQSAERYTSRSLKGQRYDLIDYIADKANLNFCTGLASDGRQLASGGLGDPNLFGFLLRPS